MSTAKAAQRSLKQANRLAEAVTHITPAMARGVISRNPGVKRLLNRRSVDIQSILDQLSPNDREALTPHRVPGNGEPVTAKRKYTRRPVAEDSLPEDLLVT